MKSSISHAEIVTNTYCFFFALDNTAMLFFTIIRTESGGAVNQRHVMVAIFFLGIAACTTSGPESTVSGAGGAGAIEQVGL